MRVRLLPGETAGAADEPDDDEDAPPAAGTRGAWVRLRQPADSLGILAITTADCTTAPKSSGALEALPVTCPSFPLSLERHVPPVGGSGGAARLASREPTGFVGGATGGRLAAGARVDSTCRPARMLLLLLASAAVVGAKVFEACDKGCPVDDAGGGAACEGSEAAMRSRRGYGALPGAIDPNGAESSGRELLLPVS